MISLLAFLTLAAWSFLALGHGRFWRADQRLNAPPPPPKWPSVTAVIPARDEAETIHEVISAHSKADYPGDFAIILVDDQSTDDTAGLAQEAATAGDRPVTVMSGAPLAEGWSGKLWAIHQGLERANQTTPDYILLTDADIVLAPDTLARLIAKAEADRLDLVSLMARLDSRGFWGGLLIPAFIYFFQKLYPFPRINDPNENTAGAAGGCMLVRTEALNEIGGVQSLRGALIDDCALARRIKDRSPHARLFLALADQEAQSRRDNRSLSSIWNMVARTAYAQLNFSLVLLFGSLLGMFFIYLGPPLIAIGLFVHGNAGAAIIALIAWAIMARTYWETLKLYQQHPWQAATLPIAAAFYSAMTFASAWRYWRGRGGQWKGRTYHSGKDD